MGPLQRFSSFSGGNIFAFGAGPVSWMFAEEKLLEINLWQFEWRFSVDFSVDFLYANIHGFHLGFPHFWCVTIPPNNGNWRSTFLKKKLLRIPWKAVFQNFYAKKCWNFLASSCFTVGFSRFRCLFFVAWDRQSNDPFWMVDKCDTIGHDFFLAIFQVNLYN